ncbi:hypothetical protein EB796_025147 [Bugula neritina]|uniref:CCHC-type domain-containing protein n=2 Tax=Bugula neritina TaxID=10212 RepID=A0A7J7ISM9_BUGNE|nr:hypothetical protein EB796_025147 [Bugula neritina]
MSKAANSSSSNLHPRVNKPVGTSHNRNTFFTSRASTYYCSYCDILGHTLSRCNLKFGKLSDFDQEKFIRSNNLCWKCLKPGHRSNKCTTACKCQVKGCGKQHPTSRHYQVVRTSSSDQVTMHSNSNHSQPNTPSLNHTQPASPAHLQTSVDHAITNSTIGVSQVPHAFSTKTANTQTLTRNKDGLKSSIIPVWLSTSPNSNKEHLVYALLDNMSDTTFISDTVADILDIPHQSLVNLKINTVNPTNHNASTQSRLFQELTIKGFYADQHISLVDVYTIPEIPLNRSHIPTKESAANYKTAQLVCS